MTILHIHHIQSREERGDNKPENFLAVCPNCYTKITKGFIGVHEVFRAKYALVAGMPTKTTPSTASNVIQFDKSSNHGLVANNLTIKTSKRTVKLNPPEGAIAGDLNSRNYIKYLIDRYNEFRKADRTIGEFRYPMIYGAIEKEFKCKWDLIPIHKFPDLVDYLQGRIDNTILGRNARKQLKGRYRSYDEFLEGLR